MLPAARKSRAQLEHKSCKCLQKSANVSEVGSWSSMALFIGWTEFAKVSSRSLLIFVKKKKKKKKNMHKIWTNICIACV